MHLKSVCHNYCFSVINNWFLIPVMSSSLITTAAWYDMVLLSHPAAHILTSTLSRASWCCGNQLFLDWFARQVAWAVESLKKRAEKTDAGKTQQNSGDPQGEPFVIFNYHHSTRVQIHLISGTCCTVGILAQLKGSGVFLQHGGGVSMARKMTLHIRKCLFTNINFYTHVWVWVCDCTSRGGC